MGLPDRGRDRRGRGRARGRRDSRSLRAPRLVVANAGSSRRGATPTTSTSTRSTARRRQRARRGRDDEARRQGAPRRRWRWRGDRGDGVAQRLACRALAGSYTASSTRCSGSSARPRSISDGTGSGERDRARAGAHRGVPGAARYRASLGRANSRGRQAQAGRATALGRMVTPEEVAKVAVSSPATSRLALRASSSGRRGHSVRAGTHPPKSKNPPPRVPCGGATRTRPADLLGRHQGRGPTVRIGPGRSHQIPPTGVGPGAHRNGLTERRRRTGEHSDTRRSGHAVR